MLPNQRIATITASRSAPAATAARFFQQWAIEPLPYGRGSESQSKAASRFSIGRPLE
jgi:hypothetical protein